MNPVQDRQPHPELGFFAGIVFEAALFVAAILWGLVFNEPVLQKLDWSWKAIGIGTIGTVPLLAVFVWTLKSKLPVFDRHRGMLCPLTRRMFGGWSVWQLALVSIAAGVGEEVFFRGAIQASLTGRIGAAAAVILVALLFGALHLLSWTYGIITTVVGVYLGTLFLATDGLLVPIVTHALYDFVALIYLLRIYRQAG